MITDERNVLTNDELEQRIADDLYELSDRLKRTDAIVIGSLLYKHMIQIREAYRTAKGIIQ